MAPAAVCGPGITGIIGTVTSAVLAAVDIGTNSVHLVVARVDGDRFDVLDREREMVRLGSSAGDMKHLTPAAVTRAVEALGRFRQVAAIHDAEVRAVATSAVREAANRDRFLRRARDEAGVDVEVISGFEEARLIHLGVLQAVPSFDRRLLVCDIGGGSTELVVGQSGDLLFSRSLKLGAIRLTRRWFDAPKLEPGAVEACRRDIRATLAPVAGAIGRIGFDVAAGSSGTIGAVVQMIAELSDGPSPRTLKNHTVKRDEIDRVVKKLVKAPTVKARSKTPGLDPRRADIVLAGALVLEGVVDALGVDELTYSDYALREGVLLDTWRRRHGGSLRRLSDLRRRSVMHLVGSMDEDPSHATQVARLALQLFDTVAERLDLGGDDRELLEAAALLANVGLYVSHASHHKHSYYLIRNSEYLTGFTDREVELIAQVARYHRKSPPRKKHAEYARLSRSDQRRVRLLAGLLRVAVGLDRNRAGRVASAEGRWEGDDRLVVVARPEDDRDIQLELYAAGQRTGLLADSLGIEVTVTATTAGPDGTGGSVGPITPGGATASRVPLLPTGE